MGGSGDSVGNTCSVVCGIRPTWWSGVPSLGNRRSAVAVARALAAVVAAAPGCVAAAGLADIMGGEAVGRVPGGLRRH